MRWSWRHYRWLFYTTLQTYCHVWCFLTFLFYFNISYIRACRNQRQVWRVFLNVFITFLFHLFLQCIYVHWKHWQLWCMCGCVEIDYVWDFGVRRPQGFLLSLKQTCPDGCTGGKLTYVVCHLFVLKMQDWTIKVKSTIPHEECWWGAHLPYLGLEPVGG